VWGLLPSCPGGFDWASSRILITSLIWTICAIRSIMSVIEIFHQLLLDGRYPQLLKGFVLTATSSRLILLAQ